MRLQDVCSIKHGFAFKGKYITHEASGYELVTPGNFSLAGGFQHAKKPKYYTGPISEEYVLEPDDLIVTMTDLSRNADTLGLSALIPNDGNKYLHNQRIGLLTCDQKQISKHYLHWLLRTREYQRTIAGMASGSTVKHTSPSSILSYEAAIPDLQTQKRVAVLLDLFDAKIKANAKLNGYLAEQCEAVVELETGQLDTLSSLCSLATKKVDCRESDISTYVSTESLLPGKMGRRKASSLPQTGKVTAYQTGDTLISNIRPYFKKIWYADCAGTCSGDVLVFRAKHPEQAEYLYSCIRNDRFFDYIMKGSKGTKMPRGDKKQMLTYKIVSNPAAQTIDFLQTALRQISITSKENNRLVSLRDALLPKLMSGEIDVSKIDLMQLNSHLA